MTREITEQKTKTTIRLGRPKATQGYSAMSPAQLIAECKAFYEEEGITALTFQKLKARKLYFPLYRKNVSLSDVIAELGLEREYREHRERTPIRRGGRQTLRWTWPRLLEVTKKIAEHHGSLPSAAWLQSNGHGSVVAAVYSLGYTYADLREALKDFSNSNFVESRNGMRWLSHAEASLSNFLYVRGIEHRKGGRYPADYAVQTGRRYGLYDLMFRASDERWIDVEVWGDKPRGREQVYATKRVAKELYNRSNPDFIGIGHKDCYQEERLATLLEDYIGKIAPFRFEKPEDKVTPFHTLEQCGRTFSLRPRARSVFP